MTGKDDRIPEDVLKAFEQAAKALYAWDSIGGDEPTVIVDGSPMPISMVATLAGTYRDMPADLYWRMAHHANCSPRRRAQASKLSHEWNFSPPTSATRIRATRTRAPSSSPGAKIAT